jgi:hypothetical protein
MTRQYIGNSPVVASVHDVEHDVEWLFADKYQAKVHYSDMAALGYTITYKEH